ncbi:MAG: KamA family radical SAM protein [Syntrophales bacterium]|nr:KamA family radical SAM protein [Syntrophales bacterium]
MKQAFNATSNWRYQWRRRIKSPKALAEMTGVSTATYEQWNKVAQVYPISVTPYFFSLAVPGDILDPIYRQFVPDESEIGLSSEKPDPLGEEEHMPVPGLIRRYEDRCLILTTHLCAVYCRHCNRKRYWSGRGAIRIERSFPAILAYLKRETSIREVILSGGDPLVLPDGKLEYLLRQIRKIPRVEVIRIGTRIPVVMPMRITKRLAGMLRKYRPLWVMTQFNHPREITPWSQMACERLISAGIPVSNQSVLLKDINDDFITLQSLFRALVRISVRPYYLFQCDPVRGTTHFQVPIEKGKELMKSIWSSTSGLCLPRYVVDLPGRQGKVALDGEGFDK